MTPKIALIVGHQEPLTPTSEPFTLFLQLLQEEGYPIETIEGSLTLQALAPYRAVLLGAPKTELSPQEIEALQQYIQGGGHLLVLSRHLLRQPLLPGVQQIREVLALPRRAREFVSFYIEGLLHRSVELSYVGGCTLSLPASPLVVTHSLLAPKEKDPAEDYVFFRATWGEGAVSVVGSVESFTDEWLKANEGNLFFLNFLLGAWLPLHARRELSSRMDRPQRHRLLHGYPMTPLMTEIASVDPGALDLFDGWVGHDPERPLVVGVLPHPFCNPALKGCGFCTFPQESYHRGEAERITSLVSKEIEAYTKKHPKTKSRRVEALYLGGGTANLTPPESMKELCQSLRNNVELTQAEVTLEGVPIYFAARKYALLETLKTELPARQHRISMGVQTFSPDQLARMGRSAFGQRKEIEEVSRTAQKMGFSVSADFLFNLPGQSLSQMKEDAQIAIDIGLSHLSFYHLVMFEGLGTEWSKDQALLASLPTNEVACDNWLALREFMLSQGFVQTTLTNFERREISESNKRFAYEHAVFAPEVYDWLGFGPAGISLRCDSEMAGAIKRMNPEGSYEYAKAAASGQYASHYFGYSYHDCRILYLTRKIAALCVERSEYKRFFEADLLVHFPQETQALQEAGLVTLDEEHLRVTPKGAFYADTIAGLFAWRRIKELKIQERLRRLAPKHPDWVLYDQDLNSSIFWRMG